MSASVNTDDKRVILVTGANKGIGYECVKQLSLLLPNATILLGTRTLDNGEQAITRMRADRVGSSFDNVHAIVVDVTDSESIDRAVGSVKSMYGGLDILIQNSGISNVDGNGAHPAVLDVNVDGARAVIESFVPIMPPATGLVVLVSSTVGTYAAYTLPSELQHILVDEPASLSWPQLQSLRDDWLAYFNNRPSRYQWTPRADLLGHYQTSKTLVNAYARMRAAQHGQPKLVLVCPGFCATDLNSHLGTDPPSKGALSVMWPIFNSGEARHGVLYLHGRELPWVQEAPELYKANNHKLFAAIAAKAAANKQ